MPPLSASRTRLRIILILALGVTAAAMPFWLRASIVGGHETAARHRLGRAAMSVMAPRFVEQTLVERLRTAPDVGTAFADAAPLIAIDGVAAHPDGSVQIPRVAVYGVDERFWRLHRLGGVTGLAGDQLAANAALIAALGIAPGSPVTLTVGRGEDAPPGTIHANRDAGGRALSLRMSRTSSDAIGDLSPLAAENNRPAAFVPLTLLQEDPEWRGRVNAILLSTGPRDNPRVNTATIDAALSRHALLADYGLRLRVDDRLQAVILESRTGLLDDAMVEAATRAALDIGGLPTPVMTTIVQSMRRGDRTVPFSFVTSIELQMVAPDIHAEELDRPPIVLNEWAARQLSAAVGDVMTLEFPVWQDAGRSTTESAPFQVAGILPMTSVAVQPLLTPSLPGITGRATLRDWAPRIPFDVSRIRPVDEEYWALFGAAPKAFVPPQVARALWRTNHGSASAIFVAPAEGVTLAETERQLDTRLRERIAPPVAGIAVRDLAEDARLRADAATRRGGRWTWWAIPLAMAAVLAALVWCAAAPIARGQATALAVTGVATGLAVSPAAAAVAQFIWWYAVGGPEDSGGFTASLTTAWPPLLVGAMTGLAAVLLFASVPVRLSRGAGRTAAATVTVLAVVAALTVAWSTRRLAFAEGTPPRAPSGGYSWFVRMTFPLMLDPATPEGLASLGLAAMPDVRVTAIRMVDGADAIRQHPLGPAGLRLAAVSQAFIDEGRFAFLASLDRTDEERANPWLLLRREQRDRSGSREAAETPIVPVITSVLTMATLQRRLGDDLAISVAGRTVRLRFVATLEDGTLDDAVVMADGPFLSWFPHAAGYHWLAIDAPRDRAPDVPAALATAMAAAGGTLVDPGEAARHARRRAVVGLTIACAIFGAAGALALSALRAARSLRL